MQCWRSTLQLGRKERRWYKHRKLRLIVVCSSYRPRRNCWNFKFFCIVFFAEDYTELLLSACRTCSTLIFPSSTNQIRELKQPRRRWQQQRHNLHTWQRKIVVLHALHVHFLFLDIWQTFSFFPRREITCFAVVWTTWAYDDQCSILSSYVPSAGSNLIPG